MAAVLRQQRDELRRADMDAIRGLVQPGYVAPSGAYYPFEGWTVVTAASEEVVAAASMNSPMVQILPDAVEGDPRFGEYPVLSWPGEPPDTGPPPPSYDDLKLKNDQLTAENADLTAQIETLEGEKETLSAENADLSGQVTDLTGQVSALTGQVDTLTMELASVRGELTQCQEDLAGVGGASAKPKK
jgi:hypothetical protein